MKTALVLIDIQKDYFPGGSMELQGSEAAAAKAGLALAWFRKKHWPVVHIRHLSVHPGATFFLPRTEGAEFHSAVAPLPGEAVIVKNFPNAFRDTTLGEELKGQGIERLAIAGMMSHMCVDATTRAAFDFGYPCVVFFDACATRNLEFGCSAIPAAQVHGAFMAALGQVYATMVGTKDMAGALLAPVG